MKHLFRLLFINFIFCASVLGKAEDFMFEGYPYTILDFDAKTCSTKAGGLLYPTFVINGEFNLPEKVYNSSEREWYTVTQIGYATFANSEDTFVGIHLPETITKICSFAFNNCSGLKSINFPSSLKEIESQAFNNTYSLDIPVFFPEGMEIIGSDAFDNYYINIFTLPSSIQRIGNLLSRSTINRQSQSRLYICSKTPPVVVDRDGNEILNHSGGSNFNKIYIPKGSLQSYLESPYFSDNNQYIEMETPLILLSKQFVQISSRETLKLESKFLQWDGEEIIDSSWSSSDSSIVSVDSNGNLTGIKEGEAEIKYSVASSDGNIYEGICDVIVSEGICAEFNMVSEDYNNLLNTDDEIILPIEIVGRKNGKAEITVVAIDEDGRFYSEEISLFVNTNVKDFDIFGGNYLDMYEYSAQTIVPINFTGEKDNFTFYVKPGKNGLGQDVWNQSFNTSMIPCSFDGNNLYVSFPSPGFYDLYIKSNDAEQYSINGKPTTRINTICVYPSLDGLCLAYEKLEENDNESAVIAREFYPNELYELYYAFEMLDNIEDKYTVNSTTPTISFNEDNVEIWYKLHGLDNVTDLTSDDLKPDADSVSTEGFYKASDDNKIYLGKLAYAPESSVVKMSLKLKKNGAETPTVYNGGDFRTDQMLTLIKANNIVTHSPYLRNDNFSEPDIFYDLLGRRIQIPGRGIYIRDGQKVVVK